MTKTASDLETRHPELAKKYPLRWLSLKLMEGDSHVSKELGLGEAVFPDDALSHLRSAHGDDIESIMADARYGLASGLTREVLQRPELKKIEITEKIDRVVLNRFLGLPIFLEAM